jgi:hypothetical protein
VGYFLREIPYVLFLNFRVASSAVVSASPSIEGVLVFILTEFVVMAILALTVLVVAGVWTVAVPNVR